MWRRLLNINISNTIAAFAGFGVNYFLVKLIGLNGFGEFSVLMAKLNLFFLFFVLIPPSYSIFKIQDDREFQHIFLSFNCYGNLILGLIVFGFFYQTGMQWVLLFYILTNGLQTYADVMLQAMGNTGLFFRLLLISALLKFLLLGLLYFLKVTITIREIWVLISVGQLVFIYILFINSIALKSKLVSVQKVVTFLISNFNMLKKYYLYAALKRIQDNSPLLFFDVFLSREAMGLFSLLLKPLIFFVSLIRTIESFLTSRENFAIFHSSFKQRLNILAVFLFFLFLPFCVIYMYVYTGKLFLPQCFLISILIPMFVAGTLARVENLAAYNQSILNISSSLFICTNLFLSILFYFSKVEGVYPVLIAYVICNILSIGYLVFKSTLNERNIV